MSDEKNKVRYGVVGAGWIAQAVFMPGVEHTGNSVLTALVTGDPEKAAKLGDKYKLLKTYSYSQFDQMLADRVVDAVYIATPNWDHESYVVRALEAGVHVLLEKPSEITVERASKIAIAAEQARGKGVRCMVAYRLHFEPGTLDLVKRVRAGEIGNPVFFSSQFSQHVAPTNHRAKHGFDAGPVPDMGPYPINAARNLFEDEPTELVAFGARHPEAGLGDLLDTVTVMLRFPKNRLAQFTVSYAGNSIGAYQLVGDKGVIEVSPAYTFEGSIEQKRTIGDSKPKHESFEETDQFAGETRYFSRCVLEGKDPEPDADEGLCDVRVIEAIRKSLETGAVQKLEPRSRSRRIDPDTQLETIGSHKQPALVNAKAPEEG